jgi:hypothetical protein
MGLMAHGAADLIEEVVYNTGASQARKTMVTLGHKRFYRLEQLYYSGHDALRPNRGVALASYPTDAAPVRKKRIQGSIISFLGSTTTPTPLQQPVSSQLVWDGVLYPSVITSSGPPQTFYTFEEAKGFVPCSDAYYQSVFNYAPLDQRERARHSLAQVVDKKGLYSMDHTHKFAPLVRAADHGISFKGVLSVVCGSDHQIAASVKTQTTRLDEVKATIKDIHARGPVSEPFVLQLGLAYLNAEVPALFMTSGHCFL